MSTVDRIFPTIQEYGEPVVTIKRVDGSDDLPEIACFDFIEYDTKTVPYSQLTSEEQSDVAEDERTIVLHFPSGYVCVDVEQLVNFAKNPNSKFYECRGSYYQSDWRVDDPIGNSLIRLGLGPGGSYFTVFTKNFLEFLRSGDRIVSVVAIPNSVVERTMSEDAAKQITEDSYVSTNHCQAGSSLSLSYLAKTEIEGVPTLARWPGVDIPLVDQESGDEENSTEEDHHDTEHYIPDITTLEGVDFSDMVYVVFSHDFNEDIRAVDWGTSVNSVVFGDEFNQPIVGVDWGPNIEFVMFGNMFNQHIDIDWKNVKDVTLGRMFDRDITDVNWGRIEELKLYSAVFNRDIRGTSWNNVFNLELPESFNHDISGIDWENVELVTFGTDFDQDITRVNWGNVKDVNLSYSNFNRDISGVDWEGVEQVSLGNDFDKDISWVDWKTVLDVSLPYGYTFDINDNPIVDIHTRTGPGRVVPSRGQRYGRTEENLP